MTARRGCRAGRNNEDLADLIIGAVADLFDGKPYAQEIIDNAIQEARHPRAMVKRHEEFLGLYVTSILARSLISPTDPAR